MNKTTGGVYKIKNIINGKFYIGSSINIKERWSEHKRQLRKNIHHNEHLQRSWNKYGEENFEFSIIEECAKDKTLKREQYYLDLLKTYDKNKGYNISKDATAPMKGRKFSKETLKKLSIGVKNRDSSCWVKGEDKKNTKLKNEDIVDIKKLIYEGFKIYKIAEKYNVKSNTITQIKTGERWSHIKTKYDDLIIQTPKQKITEEQVVEIKKLLIENELTIKEIANKFALTFGMISSIKNLKSWKNVGSEFNDELKNRRNVRKLNKSMVTEIKKMLLEGIETVKIAQKFNVDRKTILNIKNNKDWKEVSI